MPNIHETASAIGLTKAGLGFLAIHYSETHTGLMTEAPVLLSTVAFLVVFEFLQYWFHRLSHEGKGPIGRFLWRAHLAHHLPDKVYVMMHAVFNPVNAILSTAIIQIPLILLGLPPAAALAATLLFDLQSLVSHFNMDTREAKNFGDTLAIWDLAFGTHHYRPGYRPAKLGLEQADEYPESEDILKVIALPFTKTGRSPKAGRRS